MTSTPDVAVLLQLAGGFATLAAVVMLPVDYACPYGFSDPAVAIGPGFYVVPRRRG